MSKNTRRESSNLNRIFSMWEKGTPHTAIIDDLEKNESLLRSSREKGIESELNALRALRKLWYVREVTQLGKKSKHHDHQSHDLKVLLDPISCLSVLETGLKIANDYVFVEVKSSEVGIMRYKAMTIANMGLKNEDEFRALMYSKKTILLNGQQNDGLIQDDFLRELVLVNQAWANRKT